MAKLIFSLNTSDSLDFPLNADVIRMGRHPGNDIVINNSWISSNHAEFRREQGQLVLRDLHSSNGTSVNGTPITEHILAHGDRIAFGQLEAVYEAEAPGMASAVASPSPQIRPNPVAKPMPAPVAKVFPAPSLAGTTPVKEPVKPAPAPVIVAKAMAPPAATIAYDTARKEMSAELEEIQKKTIEAHALAASARQARDAAKEELARVKAAVVEAQKEFGQWQESEQAARRASEAENKEAAEAAHRSATEAKAALVRLEEQTLVAQQELENLLSEKQSVQALLASTRAETERASAGLTGLRAELTTLRTALQQSMTEAVSQKESVLAEAATLANRQASLLAETRVMEGRLENLRRETEGAAALNAKVADLRQQQAETERRLDILNDRLHGMSEAPDPNWGTVHSLARSFIKKLDLIDDLISHLGNRPEAAETLDQLSIFRSGLLDILKEYSIEAYSLEPGTVIDVAARKRIQIVETLSEGSHDGTRIVRTYRPGYVCLNGDLGIPTLLRKADVAVSIAMS